MVREDHCIGCGHCVDVCEADALHHSLFPADKVHTIDRSTLPSPESLMEQADRKSTRLNSSHT